ncbi:hypothetical protein [Bacillus toyonensis]|uniref:hypothetical protein n=1 Tax=Bacillus toyonensis TaxID=155322 RepID=UPI00368D84FB
MKKSIAVLSTIAMMTGMIASTQYAHASSYGSVDSYNQRKVFEMNFDNEKTIDSVSGNEYKTTSNKETFVPGSKNKGLQINGDDIKVPIKDLSIEQDDTITLSFWFKWDGDLKGNSNRDGIIPIGFGKYGLWLNNGDFGFNTGNDDIYGVKDKIKVNQFSHVIAVFHKNDVEKNELYINGEEQDIKQIRGTVNNKNAIFNTNYFQISGWNGQEIHKVTGNSVIDEVNLYKGSTDEKQAKEMFLLSRVPDLSVRQNNLHARVDWATEILDTDLFYKTSFENGEEKPTFPPRSNTPDGSQSFTNEESYDGETSVKIGSTVNGKGNNWFNESEDKSQHKSETSYMNFSRRQTAPNGSHFSMSVKVKPKGHSTITSTAIGGPINKTFTLASIYGYRKPLTLLEGAKAGSKRLKVDNLEQFPIDVVNNRMRNYYYADKIIPEANPDRFYDYGYITHIDLETKTMELSRPIAEDFPKGADVPGHTHFNPAYFPTKELFNSDTWKTINLNTTVDNKDYYDTAKRGFTYFITSWVLNEMYIDDVRMGYATEVELYRDGNKVYRGYNSEFEDKGATDKEKPDMVRKITFNGDKDDLSINFEKPKDLGTKYVYNIKGLSKTGETPLSKEKEVTVTSGVKGYSYVIDKNKNTIPSDKINLTTEALKTSLKEKGQHYLHLKAIDGQGNASEVKHIPIEIPDLVTKANNEENFVHLEWTKGSVEPYTYKVFKEQEGSKEFQTTSTSSYKDGIHVLEIYPETRSQDNTNKDYIPMIDFSNWKGEAFTLPKSASLKKWMEEPNKENEKGYGKGLIHVDAVSITEFNKNPSMIHKYDELVFGLWNNNNWQDISNDSVAEVNTFVASGKGLLFGHDTIHHLRPNFIKIGEGNGIEYVNENVNIYNGNNDKKQFVTGNSTVEINKKGLLTNYPWAIGDIGTKLKIPFAHTYKQKTAGDIWLRFNYENIGMDDPLNFYLTTRNNIAMIQTGHSNGEATPDEQKILSNTLFYLAQLTSATELDDRSSQDVTSPTIPSITSMNLGSDGNVSIDYKGAVDKGTDYEYYVETTGGNSNSKLKSNISKATITSGMKGYSIVVDEKSDTVPDAEIETKGTSYTVSPPNTKDFYVHVASVDKVGNVSAVSHYHYEDKQAPVLMIEPNVKEWTNKEIVLHVTATDKDSRVMKLQMPNGDWVHGNKATYIVKENGIYFFQAVDQGGNETVQSIVVSNIDKKNPKADISAPENWMNRDVEVKIVGNDE